MLNTFNIIKNLNRGMKEKPLYVYTQEQREEFENYICKTFGEFTKVFHELYSPDIHLDILIVPPTEEKNYYTLITRGIGAYRMNVPSILKDLELERMELVIKLPPDWNFDFKKEDNYWVVRQLKILGRLPIENNCWLGNGHTFSHSENNDVPLSPTSNFTASVLIDAKESLSNDFFINNKERINFYQILPLYKEEVEFYKNQHDLDKLLELFSWRDLKGVVDVNRKNYCENIEYNKNNNDIELEME
ncbi:MAG: suppressor of fused domain protein [Methanobrevibacter sp.]|nr:suppressor of fused domain protein [Methanobrevibacter sp.]